MLGTSYGFKQDIKSVVALPRRCSLGSLNHFGRHPFGSSLLDTIDPVLDLPAFLLWLRLSPSLSHTYMAFTHDHRRPLRHSLPKRRLAEPWGRQVIRVNPFGGPVWPTR